MLISTVALFGDVCALLHVNYAERACLRDYDDGSLIRPYVTFRSGSTCINQRRKFDPHNSRKKLGEMYKETSISIQVVDS